MRVAFSLLLILVCISSLAQRVDLLSKDETGMYKHALDSAISTIQKEKSLHVLYIDALECVSNYLPDTIQDVAIVTDKRKVKRKKGKLKPDELMLTVACGKIVNGEAVVMIRAQEPSEWFFVFGYEFTPGNKEPKLRYVNRGPIKFQ